MFIAFSVAPIENTDTITPTITATCCFHGVAPIRNPVFKSCDVSPAFEAAMHTIPPIVIASAPNAGAVHPFTRKIAATAISVAIVIPLTGLALDPTIPTMRADTVTNKNPKTTTISDAARFASHPTCAPGIGLNSKNKNISAINTTLPPITTLIGISFSVLSGFSAATPFFSPIFANPALNALTIVGAVRSSVINPLAATAPAPIGRTYVDHKSLGLICAIGTTPGYSGPGRCLPKKTIAGISTSQLNTPPASMIAATRIPMMYPTPRYSGVTSARIAAPFKICCPCGSKFGDQFGVAGNKLNKFSF